ncbi:diphosphomevalonate decarboxylase [Marinilabilia rubra]|uniref:diphosphomevalonate decarboxylase n=1 Tax=Marinilabilia rubra TaxID=2162893 RepID=A0A2U2B566_9BACT|nr:diphosphomevalonate decarboxylase [Marinilabilia rubra]PWD98221.1 diphosphomevalonate decarboxylase [Marinilabilia rubra]
MTHTASLTSTWQSPSNLAIVKYWGKKNIQEPVNPSVSFSLSQAFTRTSVNLTPKEGGGFSFKLDQQPVPKFENKIETFFKAARPRLPIIENYYFDIESTNTFPHSTGIASSASAMSALAFCLADLQQQVDGKKDLDITEVSSLARIGSGSASRSVYGSWSLWGRMSELPESSDIYAIPVPADIAPVFRNLHDDILIVSSQDKPVSSTQGHKLMDNHPYREGRISQARQNTLTLLKHLSSGSFEGFAEIAESEALSLHGLMMSSTPPYTLLLPNTLSIIEKIKDFRNRKDIPVTFTMDAGPNIHLLYPDEFSKEIAEWEEKEIKPFCANGRIIRDQVGRGPKKGIATKN